MRFRDGAEIPVIVVNGPHSAAAVGLFALGGGVFCGAGAATGIALIEALCVCFDF